MSRCERRKPVINVDKNTIKFITIELAVYPRSGTGQWLSLFIKPPKKVKCKDVRTSLVRIVHAV